MGHSRLLTQSKNEPVLPSCMDCLEEPSAFRRFHFILYRIRASIFRQKLVLSGKSLRKYQELL